MKYKYFRIQIIGLYIFAAFIACAQYKPEVVKVNKYLEVINDLKQYPNKLNNLSNYDLKKIAVIMYEAFESGPVEIAESLSKQNKNWENNVKIDKIYSRDLRPGNIQGKLFELIEKRLSKKDAQLIRLPFLVKGKILSINTFKYSDPYSQFKAVKTEIKIKIEEVLKGKLNKSDTITFFYMNHWDKPKNNFVIGDEYLLPLELRSENDTNYNLIALVTYLDENHGHIKIEKGKILDNYDYFELGDKNDWASFKNKFSQRIEKIKSIEQRSNKQRKL